jgi:hypothetical protein
MVHSKTTLVDVLRSQKCHGHGLQGRTKLFKVADKMKITAFFSAMRHQWCNKYGAPNTTTAYLNTVNKGRLPAVMSQEELLAR